MKIELHEISVQEIVGYNSHFKECRGYKDNGEDGVYGMGGKLNIRPAYQREFVYKDAQRNAVINTITNERPLNIFYLAINIHGDYEVLDGQQRLISIGQYVNSDFSLDNMFFHNLTDDQRNQILNYKLLIYFCEGEEKQKLEWFETINTGSEKLTEQELRNAIYTGPWLSDAKKYFSKTDCVAYKIASAYMKGTPIRQDYLETVLKWKSKNNIEEYMAENQHLENAFELRDYYEKCITWFKTVFPKYRKEMKGLPIGELYNEFNNNEYDAGHMEETVSSLMVDEDVQKKKGIYLYVLTGNEKHLNIREFTDNQKREAYEKQAGICTRCEEGFKIEEMEGDHITPWTKGGKTVPENCQMLCLHCNRTKSSK